MDSPISKNYSNEELVKFLVDRYGVSFEDYIISCGTSSIDLEVRKGSHVRLCFACNHLEPENERQHKIAMTCDGSKESKIFIHCDRMGNEKQEIFPDRYEGVGISSKVTLSAKTHYTARPGFPDQSFFIEGSPYNSRERGLSMEVIGIRIGRLLSRYRKYKDIGSLMMIFHLVTYPWLVMISDKWYAYDFDTDLWIHGKIRSYTLFSRVINQFNKYFVRMETSKTKAWLKNAAILISGKMSSGELYRGVVSNSNLWYTSSRRWGMIKYVKNAIPLLDAQSNHKGDKQSPNTPQSIPVLNDDEQDAYWRTLCPAIEYPDDHRFESKSQSRPTFVPTPTSIPQKTVVGLASQIVNQRERLESKRELTIAPVQKRLPRIFPQDPIRIAEKEMIKRRQMEAKKLREERAKTLQTQKAESTEGKVSPIPIPSSLEPSSQSSSSQSALVQSASVQSASVQSPIILSLPEVIPSAAVPKSLLASILDLSIFGIGTDDAAKALIENQKAIEGSIIASQKEMKEKEVEKKVEKEEETLEERIAIETRKIEDEMLNNVDFPVCPWCSVRVDIRERNCGIFRHAIHKSNKQPIDPHMTEGVLTELTKSSLIIGCGKPFKLVDKETGRIEKCDYI